MKALREHLQRMHNINLVVESYYYAGLVLEIRFKNYGSIVPYPYSPVELNLESELDLLSGRGLTAGHRLFKEYGLFTRVAIDRKDSKDCPDCKDGYYYPLIGSREPCRRCS